MPRQPRVVPVSAEEYARQRAVVAARCLRFEVMGSSMIEDSIDRESKGLGEYVWLDPERIVIPLLVGQGLVKEAPMEAKPDAKAKASKDA